MSRSRKKVHGFCDRNPWAKNQANRRIRRISVEQEIQNGSRYRKLYPQWDICDWKSLYFGSQVQIKREIQIWRQPEDINTLLRQMKTK